MIWKAKFSCVKRKILALHQGNYQQKHISLSLQN